MSELDPKTFDVDEWLTGAKLPEHSVVVYGRADLVAQADELERRIADAERDEEAAIGEYSVGEQRESARLREEYEALADEFAKSARTFRVRAVKPSERDILDAKEERGEIRKGERGLHEIAVALVEPRMTVDQIRKMRETIGDAQVAKIMNALVRATGEQPEVSPAFLPRRSGRDAGRE
jgi:hypothetical protein